MKKSDEMRKLMAQPKKEVKAKKAKKEVKIDADVNKDGKIDEKDVSALAEAVAKVKKKIVKQKD